MTEQIVTVQPRQKIVIVERGPYREAVTLARHTERGRPSTRTDRTADGERLAKQLNGVRGLAWYFDDDDPFTVLLRPVHELLRPWAEIEPDAVAAFSAAHGVDYHVVRDNQTEAGS